MHRKRDYIIVVREFNKNISYKVKYKWFILIGTLFIILSMFINWFGYCNNKMDISIIITISTFITLMGILVIIINNEDFVFDLRFITLVFYYVYNYYVPMIYILNNSRYIIYMNKINFSFTHDTLIKSIYNSNAYLIGLVFGIIVLCAKTKKITLDVRKISINYWLGLFLLSSFWCLYPYFVVGIGEALKLDRWTRYVLFGQIKNVGGIPTVFNLLFSNILILLAIAMICKSYVEDSKNIYKKIIFYTVVIFQSIFWLLIDIRRREVLYLVIIIFLLCKLTYNFKIKLKHILTLVSIGVMFLGYQYVKNYFPVVVKDGVQAAVEQYKFDNSRKKSIEKLLQNEFGMVYVNNLYIADSNIEHEEGKTYIEAILKNIPFFDYILYEWFGFEKTYIISNIMAKGYSEIYNSGGGLGFSPAAEASVNFGNGSLGVVLTGFFTGLLINFLMFIFYKPKYIVLYSLLLVQGVNFSRITLVGVTQEVVWIFIYYIVYRMIESIILKRYKNIRRITNV